MAVALRQELLTFSAKKWKMRGVAGAALHQLLLSVFFHELDDRIAKLIFLMFAGLQTC